MFENWENFYLLIGSAAGALIGLLFVVATLTAGIERQRAQRGASLFMTPTVFHFAIVVVISAIAMTPRLGAATTGLLLMTAALISFAYIARKAIALRKHDATEHWTDFWFYGAAPLLCYLALAGVAAALCRQAPSAPYLLAALLVILLLLAIRNAWDLVTWIAPRVEEMKAPD